MRKFLAPAAILVTAVTFPSLALAHPGHVGAMDVAAGLAHPLSGLDHVAALLGAGFLAAMLGRRGLLCVPVAFLAALVLGFVLGQFRVELPLVEAVLAVSGLVMIGAGLVAKKLATGVALAISAGFALFHGVAHGLEVPATVDGFGFGLGFIVLSALLVGSGMALTALGGKATATA